MLPPDNLHPYHLVLLARMAQSHSVGKDVCLVGGRGEGKSYVGRLFAHLLGSSSSSSSSSHTNEVNSDTHSARYNII